MLDGRATPSSWRRSTRPASSRACSSGASCRCATGSRSTTPTAAAFTLDDPYAFLPTLGELDLHLVGEGRHEELCEQLGAHVRELDGRRRARRSRSGRRPRARSASSATSTPGTAALHPMRSLGSSGHLGAVPPRRRSRARATSSRSAAPTATLRLKADPVRASRPSCRRGPPRSSRSRATSGADGDWLRAAPRADPLARADVDLRGAPRLVAAATPLEGNRPLTYLELADELAAYAARPGLHARRAAAGDGAPVHRLVGLPGDRLLRARRPRYGSPDDLREFVDRLHQRGIGVILDWVPAHFPRDDWALARFDGTALYEHDDPRRGAHPDWGTLVFNYGRNEVRNFLRRERALLAARVPRRRPARRRRRLDALPRLLAQGGRVDAEPVRRPRGPRRRSRSCAS